MAEVDALEMSKMDCYIGVRGSDNVSELSDAPSECMMLYDTYYQTPVHHGIRVPKTRWVILRYPNAAMAQLAGMSVEKFEDFYFQVCNLDYSKMNAAMEALTGYMERTDNVRITGPGTDLSFSIKGHSGNTVCRKHEHTGRRGVYAPVRESVNGKITYNAPSLYNGFTYDNICLEFENGRIVKAVANDTERINEVFDTDQGARYIGEFAIGVNPYILEPMKRYFI